MITLDENIQYRHIAQMQLARAMKAANRRGLFASQGKSHKTLTKDERQALMDWLGTWDGTDDFTSMDSVKYEAVKVLLSMRERQEGSKSPRASAEELEALEALWRSIDPYA